MAIILDGTTGISTGDGNLSITGNVTTSGTLASSAGTTYPLVSGTEQNASGTNVDFTGLPSWVKRITVTVSGLSLSGTGWYGIRLGTSDGFITSGYISVQAKIVGATTSTSSSGTMFLWHPNLASETNHGQMIITQHNSSTWVATGLFAASVSGTYIINNSAGRITGAGQIDRVQVISGNGTDTFDAGTVNIMYE